MADDKDNTIKNLRQTVRDQRYSISQLEASNDGLRERLRQLESSAAGKLEQLAIWTEAAPQTVAVPQTPAQWARCLREIAKGGDWQNGTWK